MKYLSVKDLAIRFGVSIQTIWVWSGDGPYCIKGFPKPVKLGPQVVRWKLDDVEAWEASRESAA
ncbi:AlpA family phage regulatory protein [Paracoccus sp. YIM 132242]|uniref:AlpA family phage regulatory protein n=1 Tax=Paracoccus lichenicola TaxID=2665644 RepID=A0A6L6HL69_9RHOB|nr:AlpA family phage regulatory protein [Paracoccus lichenicola]MTD99926.1 AlpA family phage regulatory protein [Paracoccus lichenicola]